MDQAQRFLLDGEPERQSQFIKYCFFFFFFNAALLTGKPTHRFEKPFNELHISWYFLFKITYGG